VQLPIRWVFCGPSPHAGSAKYPLAGPQSAGPQNTHGQLFQQETFCLPV